MRALPPDDDGMPAALQLEEPAKHLASLVMNESFGRLTDVLLSQWLRLEDFEPLKRHGIYPLNRALFFGPPGNGKTVSAQLIASKLDCPLYRVRSEALITSYLGETTQSVGFVMDWLEDQEQCVVLWDEAEAIFPSRERMDGSGSAREMTNAMTVFWQRLDRWKSPQLFLLATNMKDRLDPALCSRIELQLEFGPPTAQQARDVLSYWSEVLHEYGAETWGRRMQAAIDDGHLPESFRALWQDIANAVRSQVALGVGTS